MSTIQSINNLINQSWEISESNISYDFVNLYIGFTDGNPVVEFNNLSFSYELIRLTHPTTLIQKETYPKNNIVYVSTDEEFLVTEYLPVQPNVQYSLNLKSTNNEKFSETEFIFITPSEPTPVPPGPTGATGGINF
jgi:hypothetical protein